MNAKRTTAAVCAIALAVGAAGVPAGELFALETAVTASAADFSELNELEHKADHEHLEKNFFGLYSMGSTEAAAADGTLTNGRCGENLTWSIDSEGTVTISGTGAMYDYSSNSLSPWYENSSVKNVVINDGVTHIGNHAFYHVYNLTSVSIPNSVTSIGSWAFCSANITDVTIPDSVTTIGDSAFGFCPALTSVTIPSSVKKMEAYPFIDCSALISIDVDPQNPYFTSVDGVLYNKSVSKLIGFPGGRSEVTIPDTVTNIGESAFFGAVNIKQVDIPENVTIIGTEAFGACSSLEKINVPKGVQKIEGAAFWDCKKLTDITISEGVKKIGWGAFDSCTSLTEVTLPDSLKTIENHAFADCASLTSITIPAGVTAIGKEALGYCSDASGKYKKVNDFTINCFSGTAGEKYAKNIGLGYEVIGDGSSLYITKATFKLSSTSITYTGKAKMPTLTVTYNGKKLVKGTDYKVTLSNSKKVGKATATVTGIGKYSGTKKLTYYVVPVKPAISKVTSTAKKKATVQWKKNSTATGYQIQVSLKKNFSTKKSYSISKNSTVKTTISKLTSGKTYYVRMRCYKTIDGVKRYSAYSAVKTVKVK